MFFSASSLLPPIIGAISGDHNNAMMVAGAVVVPGINKSNFAKKCFAKFAGFVIICLSKVPRLETINCPRYPSLSVSVLSKSLNC